MSRFHHANLGVPPDAADAEAEFLVGVLGYRRLEPSSVALGRGARWFEADDGTQIHLSLDPDHVPAAKAHTAIEVGADCAAIEARLTAAGIPFTAGDFDGRRIVICRDPAGNGWELRG
ncbi:conserved hypothetical protein [Parafrankia sp. EAN1pec]|uniref:VOC family protein n=1 Tax=Parafrankia sp. (strain EAN1pec) TaxID=298653 RepID=UPI00015D9D15|nr:conserved hypothetical protein [Frankia sp. EAN1pec]